MLRLRKILLSDYLYLSIVIFTLLVTIYRLCIPLESNYNESDTTFTGIIEKIIIKDDKVTIYIKNKETIIGTYYLNRLNYSNLKLGDKVRINGLFKLPTSNTTKYLFNYQKYLKRRKTFYLVEISSLKKIKNNNKLYYYLKQKLINRLNYNAYLYTFILGDKTYLDSNVKRSYQSNGISHLFCISGMHITLLVSIINKLLKRLKLNEFNLFLITSTVLIIYLLLVGLSPSILRSILFYIIFSINNIKYFYIKPTNLFLIVLSISLLINPYYIYDIGYLYSYSISFVLIKMSNTLQNNNYCKVIIKTSIISLIVSLPITLYNFYEINILSIIYNLLFVPLVSLIIFPMSLLVVIIKPLLPIYNLLILELEELSLFFSKISFGKLIFKRLPIYIYVIYFSLVIVYLYKPKKVFIYLYFCLLLIHYIIPYFDYSDYMMALDVGQGDSILIHSNNKSILIDTGGTYNEGVIFYNTIGPTLKSKGIKKLDCLILSHGDQDHIGESITLVENYKVSKVIFNCGEYNYLEKKLIKRLNKKRIKYYSCVKKLDKLYFLNTGLYNNENDNSNVVYTQINNKKVLLMGDASINREKDILEEYNLSNIDILKVGHHGSNTSSSETFIEEINPKNSIISVGENNRYGHPNKGVLNTLRNSTIYRTDEQGSIVFRFKDF